MESYLPVSSICTAVIVMKDKTRHLAKLKGLLNFRRMFTTVHITLSDVIKSCDCVSKNSHNFTSRQ